jgi:hypothetical protein
MDRLTKGNSPRALLPKWREKEKSKADRRRRPIDGWSKETIDLCNGFPDERHGQGN